MLQARQTVSTNRCLRFWVRKAAQRMAESASAGHWGLRGALKQGETSSSSPAVTMEPAASSYGSRAASCLADGRAFPQSRQGNCSPPPLPNRTAGRLRAGAADTLPTVSAFKRTSEWDFSFQRQTFPFSSRTLHFEARLRSRPPSTSAQGAAGRPWAQRAGKTPFHGDTEDAAPTLSLMSSPSDGRVAAAETPQHTGLHLKLWTRPWLTATAGTVRKQVFPQVMVFSQLKRGTLKTNERILLNGL